MSASQLQRAGGAAYGRAVIRIVVAALVMHLLQVGYIKPTVLQLFYL